MQVIFKPFDTRHYLMNLRMNMAGALQSDRVGDAYILILRLPFEQDFNQITPQIFREMLQNYGQTLCAECNHFVQVGENAQVGLFLRAAVVTGFQVTGVQNQAASYAMFCCEIALDPASGQNLLTVYASPNGLFAAANVCKVPAMLQLHLEKEVVTRHRREKATGYYTVDFTGFVELAQGSVWYTIPGSKIRFPITTAMVKQKRIYIKTEAQPSFQSAGGVRVTLI